VHRIGGLGSEHFANGALFRSSLPYPHICR
jgi:hypothetical protein